MADRHRKKGEPIWLPFFARTDSADPLTRFYDLEGRRDTQILGDWGKAPDPVDDEDEANSVLSVVQSCRSQPAATGIHINSDAAARWYREHRRRATPGLRRA